MAALSACAPKYSFRMTLLFGWTKRVEDLNSHTALRGNNAVCAILCFNLFQLILQLIQYLRRGRKAEPASPLTPSPFHRKQRRPLYIPGSGGRAAGDPALRDTPALRLLKPMKNQGNWLSPVCNHIWGHAEKRGCGKLLVLEVVTPTKTLDCCS